MKKYRYMVGIDEVGRGPLAGPVTVCAVVLSYHYARKLKKTKDSKQLNKRQREVMVQNIKQIPGLRYKIVSVSAKMIDSVGIEKVTKRALDQSLAKLELPPGSTFVYLDGRLSADKKYDQETVIKGDEKIPLISFASILAKVHRDKLMSRYDVLYPGYGFDQHAGYGTRQHYRAIAVRGRSPIHRSSYLH